MAYTMVKQPATSGSKKKKETYEKTPQAASGPREKAAQSRSGAVSGRREFAAQEARLQSVVEALKTRHGSSLGLFLYDLDAGKKEIEALEETLCSLQRSASLAQGRSALQNTYLGAPVRQDFDFRRNAEQTRAVQQALSGKKQAYNLAKRYQEAVAYGDTVKNGDFHRLSAYVPSEDPLYNWINDPAYRESYEAQYSKTFRTAFRDSPYRGQKASPFARSGYDRMNESETAIYNYYYAKEGREAAQKYLDSIQESLNARTAEDLYGTVSGDAGLEILFGAAASVGGFEGGVRSAFNFKDGHIAKTPHRIASSKVREDLSDVGPKLPGWLGGGSLGQLAYDAVGAAAYMAPSVLVSYATGIPMAGNALMGIGAAGSAYAQALNEGYDRNQARGYGLLTGMAETALEKFLGGISAYGGNRLGKKAVQNLANVDDALKMLGGKLGGSMLGEFREEYLQEVLDPVIRHITLKTEEEMNLLSPDALYSGFLGALLGPGIESVDAVVNGLPVEFNDIDTPSEKAFTPTIDDAEMDAIFEGIEDLDGWKRLKSLPKAEQEAFISSLTIDALEENTPAAAEKTAHPTAENSQTENLSVEETAERGILKLKNSELTNGLPIKGTANSTVDKTDENGKTLQRRIYGDDGMAIIDLDTSDHGQPKAHPNGAHKHIFDYSKKKPRGNPQAFTAEELETYKDIIRKGENYHDKSGID